ncbi:protease pro-enzyme activation domain-containing protein [Tersicoccus sp. Bi-70]|uniref:S53 family peptidase n=1 Tax=Tersicoccus sp. Bi-70 TaxID=1897634 RepID=UPI0009F86343|nr:S53 family peptidase [Tersicoccus sp. Bi-70]
MRALRRSTGSGRAAALAAGITCLLTIGATGAVAAPPGPHTLAGSVPSWATAANDQGAAATDTTVEGEIYLPLRNADQARALATSVSTPTSPNYRHWLSPQQWIQRFSPTQADLNSVLAYLKAHHATITAVPESRQFVVFRTTAAQAGTAFGTQLHRYVHGGRSVVAPSTAASVPAALAGKVAGVSLDQGRLLTHPDLVKPDAPSPAPRKAAAATPAVQTPCSTYWNEHQVTVPPAYGGNTRYGTYICGYQPSQLQSAYGLTTYTKHGVDGHGQTVAIIDAYASPTMRQDANRFSAAAGLPQLTASTYREIVPSPSQFTDQALCAQPSGWQGEETLDVESVHGVAPGASILYVGGTNCGGGLDVAMAKILDRKLATIVSNSYGNQGENLPADAIAGEVNEQMQAAAEGIGLYFSSGDSGDEAAALGYPDPDFPASSPWVTSIGGTSLAVGRNGNYLFETGWGSSRQQIVTTSTGGLAYAGALPGTFRFGAGGGPSLLFPEPAYQRGVVPSSLANGHRVSPDLAAVADPYTGYQIGYRPIVDDATLQTGDYINETYGGTSLASPVVAAQMAIAQQLTHRTLGFANPTIYLTDRYAPSLFRDVLPQNPRQALAFTSETTGSSYLISLDTDTSLTTKRGYDDVTGVGSLSLNVAATLLRR